jgi:hypothetical protein
MAPITAFMYALKAKSKRQYSKQLEVFLKFINIGGLNLEERLCNLYNKSKPLLKILRMVYMSKRYDQFFIDGVKNLSQIRPL